MKEYHFNEEHQLFRKSLRDFLDREIVPFIDQWEENGQVPRDAFQKMGEMGYFGLGFDEKYGGLDTDIYYSIILIEELNKCNSGGTAASLLGHSTLALEHIFRTGSEMLTGNGSVFS